VVDAGSFMVFVAAVAAAATWGHLAAGLLCTVFSVAAIDFFFLAPRYTLVVVAETDLVLLVTFSGLAMGVSWLTERARERYQRELLRSAGTAALLERQLTELERDLDASEILRKARRDQRS
jgi:K+-sensing histidine kinase KdpD